MPSDQVVEGLRVEWEAIANWRAGLIARLKIDRFLSGGVAELIDLARKKNNRLPPPCEWTGQVGRVDLGRILICDATYWRSTRLNVPRPTRERSRRSMLIGEN